MIENITADERAAMRAYVQRMEVRLSTLHRIAGLFIGGAGLLFLLPVLLRDTVKDINEVALSQITPIVLAEIKITTSLLAPHLPSEFWIYLLLFIPFAISVGLPLYALYLLFQDIVQFYFIGHHTYFPAEPFVPRFSLSAIAFSPDESPRIKREVMRQQYGSERAPILIPFQNQGVPYYDHVYRLTQGVVVPETRQIEALEQQNVFDEVHPKPSLDNFNRLNTALGLAGLTDNLLIEEVAKMEISLTRHVLGLRRIVLRYMKALILFVITTMVSFAIASVIDSYKQVLNQSPLQSISNLVVLSLGYFAWSLVVWTLIRKPIDWIWDLSNKHTKRKDVAVDGTVTGFDKFVVTISYITGGVSFLCACLSLYLAFVALR